MGVYRCVLEEGEDEAITRERKERRGMVAIQSLEQKRNKEDRLFFLFPSDALSSFLGIGSLSVALWFVGFREAKTQHITTTQKQLDTPQHNTTKDMSSSAPPSTDAAAAPAEGEKPKLKICCSCPETKKLRDQCVLINGEEKCQVEIQNHLDCLRKLGFNI